MGRLGDGWSIDASGMQEAGYWCALVSGPRNIATVLHEPDSRERARLAGRHGTVSELKDWPRSEDFYDP
jgi:hypothetical protein